MFISLVCSLLSRLWRGLSGLDDLERRPVAGTQHEEHAITQARDPSHGNTLTLHHHRDTCGRVFPDAAGASSEPLAEDHHQTPVEAKDEEASLDLDRLCSYCRTITISSLTSPSGHPFYPTRAAVKRSAAAGHGCQLCAFISSWTIGVEAKDWSLAPYGHFNGIIRVSGAVQQRLERLEEGRLCAMEMFEGAGKGLVAKFGGVHGDEIYPYKGLSLGKAKEGCGRSDEVSRSYGISVRRPLTSTGSRSSLESARRWIATCDSDHDCCRAPSSSTNTQSQSPASRLIDVWAFDEQSLDVRLVETWKETNTSKVCTHLIQPSS
ncbi:hypothetical protein B0J12DRAFT_335706 [Macrophomina phaseolina]|uniref:Uncharacterized protein n=1 Tax=Macrophomina phaseolina TaxID=35725 RepID=A0ABQ8GLG0_9PEZI|nr:hypothetical protein B0J12DRAFT_335706 [Macrophomina phaseolina]